MTTSNMVSLFSLNSSSGIPIYRQLIDQIKQAIRMNLLKPGEQLPSVRNLSSALQINPMTISKAFAQLELEGVLLRKRGVGMLVAEQEAGEDLPKNIEQPLIEFIKQAHKGGLDDEQIITLVQQYLSLETTDRT
ncbi:MAG: GntR family transcriptional regulator [Kangiellaceae bacterium]|nr:GntR family transcriptional regulator [Kangiellaceae bacterium]MCW8998226.1 GntR family transcriptional regulator [Kangiellaceae bacterium]MCW9017190.1 GntR family transcriptional regulator [Kangiellaceae bacterium]